MVLVAKWLTDFFNLFLLVSFGANSKQLTMERPAQLKRGCRVILAPCPLQGHLNPILQPGTALYNSGFSFAIVYSTFNSPDYSKYPQIDLKPIPSSDELQDLIGHSATHFIQLLNRTSEAPFRKYMSELMEEERVACV